MADEQEPAKKVAKRVVKKTVVKRPVSQKSAPSVRYGRPAAKVTAKAPPKTPSSAPRAKAGSAPSGKAVGKAGKAVTRSTGRAASAVAGGVKGAAGKIGSTGGSAVRLVKGLRIPRLEQTRASALVGLVVGVIAVGITVLFTMLFSEVRGTSTGGGRWGSLTFVVVTFIAFALGEYLLTRLQVRQPRVTSLLAICLTLLVILAAFLDLVDGVWAWLVVPLLTAATYAVAHRLIRWADSSRAQAE